MKRSYEEDNNNNDPFSEESLKRVTERITLMKKNRLSENPIYNQELFDRIETEYKNFLYNKLTTNMNTYSYNIIFNKNLNNAQLNLLRERVHKIQISLDNMYYCCSDQVRTYLLEMGAFIKKNNPEMDLRTIYSSLILTSYGLLGEQMEDYLNLKDAPAEIADLFLKLTTGDLIYQGRNISSEIRRFLLGLNDSKFEGGKKSNKKTKNRRRTYGKKIRKTSKRH